MVLKTCQQTAPIYILRVTYFKKVSGGTHLTSHRGFSKLTVHVALQLTDAYSVTFSSVEIVYFLSYCN